MPAKYLDLVVFLNGIIEVDILLLMAAYDVFPANVEKGKSWLVYYFLAYIAPADRNLKEIKENAVKLGAIIVEKKEIS
jgi:hypothetical protein